MDSSLRRGGSRKRSLGLLRRGDRELPYGKGATAGGFVFLSGIEGSVDDAGEPVEGVRAQTELALNRMHQYLGEAGADLQSIVKLVWFLRDRSHLHEFLSCRDQWFERNCLELLAERSYASTLLILGLATEEMLVEFDCIAYAGD